MAKTKSPSVRRRGRAAKPENASDAAAPVVPTPETAAMRPEAAATRPERAAAPPRSSSPIPASDDPSPELPTPEQDLPERRLERIAVRAREIYEARGGEHGQDLDDWLQAEREIDSQLEEPLAIDEEE